MSNSDDEAIAFLVGLGVLTLVGIGVYQLLKSIGSDEAGEVIPAARVPSIATTYRSYSNRSYAKCDKHGEHSEQCKASGGHENSNRCIECNGGIGDSSNRWCKTCEDDWFYD